MDWLEIKWPLPSGKTERFTGVPVDRYVTIVEGKGKVIDVGQVGRVMAGAADRRSLAHQPNAIAITRPTRPIPHQKSICAPILKNRAWRIRLGVCQIACPPGTSV